MSEQVCPRCGSAYSGTEGDGTVVFLCFSAVWTGGMYESGYCVKAQLTVAQAKIEEQEREIERLKADFTSFVGKSLTVKHVNRTKWMKWYAESINEACETLGDPDRFFYRQDGFIVRMSELSPPAQESAE